MGLAGTGSPDQNEVMGIFSELSGAEGVDPGLGDGGGTIIESGKILMVRELCNPHLILD